jgi:hypothetical protein
MLTRPVLRLSTTPPPKVTFVTVGFDVVTDISDAGFADVASFLEAVR